MTDPRIALAEALCASRDPIVPVSDDMFVDDECRTLAGRVLQALSKRDYTIVASDRLAGLVEIEAAAREFMDGGVSTPYRLSAAVSPEAHARARAVLSRSEATEKPDLASEYGRLLAERDRLIADGVAPAELDMPLRPGHREGNAP